MDIFSLMVYYEDESELETLYSTFADAQAAFFKNADQALAFPHLHIDEISLEIRGIVGPPDLPKDLEIFTTEDRPLNRHMYTMYWITQKEGQEGPVFYFYDFAVGHLATFNEQEMKDLYQAFFTGVKIGI